MAICALQGTFSIVKAWKIFWDDKKFSQKIFVKVIFYWIFEHTGFYGVIYVLKCSVK